ncbi:hypothetical protein RFY41_03020, partial [Acinetobacter soli]|uniref:hypothetical protein n=1 Tax=Acinetobacter soli TaxID=487316 RepID=UPI002813F8D0
FNPQSISTAAPVDRLNGQVKANGYAKPNQQIIQLKWNAFLTAKDFNPQSISTAAPVDRLNGQVKANGYAKPNQQ